MTTRTAPPLSIRIGDKERKALDRIARSLDRNRSYVINEAIKNYIELQERQMAKIREGIRQADAGMFASDEEVRALFKR